jgi:hypothetical protein
LTSKAPESTACCLCGFEHLRKDTLCFNCYRAIDPPVGSLYSDLMRLYEMKGLSCCDCGINNPAVLRAHGGKPEYNLHAIKINRENSIYIATLLEQPDWQERMCIKCWNCYSKTQPTAGRPRKWNETERIENARTARNNLYYRRRAARLRALGGKCHTCGEPATGIRYVGPPQDAPTAKNREAKFTRILKDPDYREFWQCYCQEHAPLKYFAKAALGLVPKPHSWGM